MIAILPKRTWFYFLNNIVAVARSKIFCKQLEHDQPFIKKTWSQEFVFFFFCKNTYAIYRFV